MTVADTVLDSFYQVLVEEIRAKRPEYLTSPFTVAEIYQDLVPYPTHRDRIGVEMNGDYEDALIRLLAGEGGYLVLESDHALEDLRSELQSRNPNTGVYREYAAVDVRLNPGRREGDEGGTEVARPEAEVGAVGRQDAATSDGEAAPSTAEFAGDAGEEDMQQADACRWCRAPLPARDNLNFCPYCGIDVHAVPCAGCGEQLEPEWRFCIACGTERAP
ncbi:MAG: zinc ribbon domain-containing protein [Gemmatimonadota bacterium]|nr:zinc ribbon domain-containing protein [Gemmatimonadota bacterium]